MIKKTFAEQDFENALKNIDMFHNQIESVKNKKK